MINILHIGLSYNCNLRCKHCFVNKENDKFPVKKVKECIDFLSNQGLFTIFYTYGEPLLARDFEEITDFVRLKGIIQILMTNGTMINELNIEIIKRNIHTVYVSIDSPIIKEHDENRGVNGAFEKAIGAIKLLKRNSINVGIAFTVRRENCNQVYNMIGLAQKLGVKLISLLRERKENKILQLPLECEYYKLYRDYVVKEDNDMKILFHDIQLNNILEGMRDKKEINEGIFERYTIMNDCHIRNTISIAPNGDVSKCNLCQHSIANINEQNIKDIVEGDDFKNEYSICFAKLPQ